MIINYRNKGTRDIAFGINRKEACRILPLDLHQRARGLLAVLDAARAIDGLMSPGLRLEKLHGDRRGQRSIRINDKYRVCFYWEESKAGNVEIVDYH